MWKFIILELYGNRITLCEVKALPNGIPVQRAVPRANVAHKYLENACLVHGWSLLIEHLYPLVGCVSLRFSLSCCL